MANRETTDGADFESAVRGMFLRSGSRAPPPEQNTQPAASTRPKKQQRWQPLDIHKAASQTQSVPQNPHPRQPAGYHYRQNQSNPSVQYPRTANPSQYRGHSQQTSIDPNAFDRSRNDHYRQQQQQQQQQQPPPTFDPNAFAPRPPPPHLRAVPPRSSGPPNSNPGFRPHAQRPFLFEFCSPKTVQYLEDLASDELPGVEMSAAERQEKVLFRDVLNNALTDVCGSSANLPRARLEIFGSVGSGFASTGSDMDLAIVLSEDQEPTADISAATSLLAHHLPRVLERRLLDLGIGARLLSRTRVPIIKICQSPGPALLDKLRSAREEWDLLPDEKRYPHLHPENEDEDDGARAVQPVVAEDGADPATATVPFQALSISEAKTAAADQPAAAATDTAVAGRPGAKRGLPSQKPWTRERQAGPLDFPKTGVGVQCDINFGNPLGLHNTHLLHCYSLCDARVQPMVLFVKLWAKRRRINSAYSGTLSSYGYVLMILYYLVHVAQPPVLPNLQAPWRPRGGAYTPQGHACTQADGWLVDFWRDEAQLRAAAAHGRLTQNTEPLGALLAGFFHHFSSLGGGGRCFHWMRSVVCLRLAHGTLSKEEKGWVRATTQESEGKRIQNRYLFCIEDPFELRHNVARTVTHHGIVAIRDEFRRAFRVLQAVAAGTPSPEGDLLDALEE